MTLLAPRILNDVSYVTRINHEIHFAWQAQYLVKVEGDSCCSASLPLHQIPLHDFTDHMTASEFTSHHITSYDMTGHCKTSDHMT